MQEKTQVCECAGEKMHVRVRVCEKVHAQDSQRASARPQRTISQSMASTRCCTRAGATAARVTRHSDRRIARALGVCSGATAHPGLAGARPQHDSTS